MNTTKFKKHTLTKIALMASCGLLLTGAWCEPNLSMKPLKADTAVVVRPAAPPSYASARVKVDLNHVLDRAIREGAIPRQLAQGRAAVNTNLNLHMHRVIFKTIKKKIKVKNGHIYCGILPVICGSNWLVKEVIERVPVDDFFDKMETVDATATYDVDLADIKAHAKGNRLKVTATMDLNLSLGTDFKVGGVRVVRVNGITKCHGRVQVTTEVAMDVQNGPVLRTTPTGYWRVRHLKDCRLAGDALTLDKVLKLPVVRKSYERAMDRALKNLDKRVDLSKHAAKALKQLSTVRQLKDNVWLVPNVTKGTLSQLHGEGHMLHFTVGAHLRPEIVFSKRAPTQPRQDLSVVAVAKDAKPSVDLTLGAHVPFAQISEDLKILIAKASCERRWNA